METALSIFTARSLFAIDDEDYSMIIKLALKEAGFEGSSDLACSSEELKEGITERALPRGGSYWISSTRSNDWRECVPYLKEDKNYTKIPVVVLTAVESQADIDFCRRFDRCSHVDKPRSFDCWMVCTEKIIRRKSMGWNNH